MAEADELKDFCNTSVFWVSTHFYRYTEAKPKRDNFEICRGILYEQSEASLKYFLSCAMSCFIIITTKEVRIKRMK